MRSIPPSELLIHDDGSAFHLRLRPEQLASRVILVGDPARVAAVAGYFDSTECEASNREFRSVTGLFRGKRLTVVSHGIGTDNIDIVLTELDALANIDFSSRCLRPRLRQLTLVRIGTSGSLQASLPMGSWVAAEKSIGFDGVLYFYAGNAAVRDRELETEFLRGLPWQLPGVVPYVVNADASLLEQIAREDIPRGLTIAANGFYGPQGREVRLALADPGLNRRLEAFRYGERRITNYEMESSALAGLSALMGHRALTVCCIIADRWGRKADPSAHPTLSRLIETVLNRI
ncbi:MAG: nucleoside phosphorylase [Tannerellaceae bacterium]|jgi:uridine phosphorylase|nr:nucleoside phosphorylase [Tannerellaceae bacterium]